MKSPCMEAIKGYDLLPNRSDFDSSYPDFAFDSRNLRLAVASDGFIIPGPRALGADMDVYLEPLVLGHMMPLRMSASNYMLPYCVASQIFLTICMVVFVFVCHSHECSPQLKKGGKYVFVCHHRFLDANHVYKSLTELFYGTEEHRPAPVPLSGEEILELTANMHTSFGKGSNYKEAIKPHAGRNDAPLAWKRKSIWFRLPYWKDLLLRNIDVMHIEKNMCDNIINILLNIDGRSKDNLNARLDIKNFGIRHDLHPINVDDRFYMPLALNSMSPDEKKLFCQVSKDVRFPDGVASNIHNNVHVSEIKLIGLKSHDNHVLLQQLLPLAIRRILPTRVTATLIRVSNFFKQMYSPTIRGGRDVILYNVMRPYNLPVAKKTVQTTNHHLLWGTHLLAFNTVSLLNLFLSSPTPPSSASASASARRPMPRTLAPDGVPVRRALAAPRPRFGGEAVLRAALAFRRPRVPPMRSTRWSRRGGEIPRSAASIRRASCTVRYTFQRGEAAAQRARSNASRIRAASRRDRRAAGPGPGQAAALALRSGSGAQWCSGRLAAAARHSGAGAPRATSNPTSLRSVSPQFTPPEH
ncbi:LOW QUALITY PROTEIN: hypothetical protein U9M48_022766 [Paspalum notatum var. saurae]|uniref:Uncharacterized protein n=1 Tax=Paspalum notatum var. saurae TaxID=547442 RepID=A0AAQ3TMF8_PASNO